MTKMNERIWAPLTIHWRATSALEALVLVEAKSALVLLVHIGGKAWMVTQCRTDEHRANPHAVLFRRNEQRFEVPIVQEHEALRHVCLIAGENEIHVGEEGHDFGCDGHTILAREEIMSSVHSAAPDIQNAR
jgi:hypothetical protein